MNYRQPRPGFTLLELLVVLAIISVLLALLIPAVQQVRETASLAQCANHLRQIGIAIQNNHDMQRRFPSGGWGWAWAGMPDRGTGPEQPGGWLYNILPYIEQGQLRQRGAGEQSPQLEQSIQRVLATPLALFNCPSRRQGGPFDVQAKYSTYLVGSGATGGTARVSCSQAARADYAANAGSQGFNEIFGGPPSLLQGDSPSYHWPNTAACSGIFFQRSALSIADVTRGASNTFLAGERYIDASHYADGLDVGDNEAMYVGFDNDMYRVTLDAPRQDRAGYANARIFGSAHAAGVNMLYCDGTVRLIGYDIDPDLFMLGGKRYE